MLFLSTVSAGDVALVVPYRICGDLFEGRICAIWHPKLEYSCGVGRQDPTISAVPALGLVDERDLVTARGWEDAAQCESGIFV